jgi:hypothetical protein
LRRALRNAQRFLPYIGFLLAVAIVCTFVVLGASGSDEAEPPPPAKLPPETRLPPATEPEGTALRILRYVQAGSETGAATLYHPRVIEVVGFDRITRSLRLRRPALTGARLRVSLQERTPAGPLVVVATRGASSGDAEYSFVVRHFEGRWRVINDSLLGDALAELIQLEVQQRINPNAREPSSEAVAAGARAQSRYRQLFSGTLRRTVRE